MRVIKQGDLARVESLRRFECERCGCVFEASGTEYRTEHDYRNGVYFVMECPTCHKSVICHPEDERR